MMVYKCEQCKKKPAELEFGFNDFDHELGKTIHLIALICLDCMIKNDVKFKQKNLSYTFRWIDGRPQPQPFVFR